MGCGSPPGGSLHSCIATPLSPCPGAIVASSGMRHHPTILCLADTCQPSAITSTVSSTRVGSELSTAFENTIVARAPLLRKLQLYDFKQLKGLGGGAYGSVYLVKHIPTGMELALKVIDKRWNDHKLAVQEQNILRQVATKGTPGIMEFLGSFHNPRHFFMLAVSL